MGTKTLEEKARYSRGASEMLPNKDGKWILYSYHWRAVDAAKEAAQKAERLQADRDWCRSLTAVEAKHIYAVTTAYLNLRKESAESGPSENTPKVTALIDAAAKAEEFIPVDELEAFAAKRAEMDLAIKRLGKKIDRKTYEGKEITLSAREARGIFNALKTARENS